MRSRYDTLESEDIVDDVQAEDTRASARLSSAAEIHTIAPTTVADPESSGYAATGTFADHLLDGGQLVHEFEPIEGIPIGSLSPALAGILADRGTSATLYPDNETLIGTGGDDVIDGGLGYDEIYGLGGNDILLGGEGNDHVYGDDGHDQLDGQDGNDFLVGGTGDDSIFGRAGDDIVLGGRGIDHIYGGDGIDQLNGGADLDYIDGGADKDWLRGDGGADMLWGGAGNDLVEGGDGFDMLFGGADDDTLMGRNNFDILYGGAGSDTLYGDGLDPSGLDANDTLYGDDGHDKLYGHGGDDVLNGGAGVDMLTGGAGRDTFVFTHFPIQNDATAQFDIDTIKDFQFYTGNTSFTGDWIDLSNLFEQYTTFTGSTAFEAFQQGYLYFVDYAGGNGTMLYIDPNGNAPDPTTHYDSHDKWIVTLEGVSKTEFGDFSQEGAFLNKYILV